MAPRPRFVHPGRPASPHTTRQPRRRRPIAIELLEERVVPANWSGTIPNGTVFVNSEVHRITGDATIAAGTLLTIQPGTIVKFNASTDLFVNGTLNADGSPGQPIIFTSARDDSAGGDTNGDGPSSGVRGEWNQIAFNAGSTGSLMDSVEVRFGGDQFFGATPASVVVNATAQLNLLNSTIRDSEVAGLRIVGASPTVSGVTIKDNTGAAVSMDLAANPAISGVTLTNSGVNGLAMDGGTLSASRTWGAPDLVYRLTGDVTVAAGATLTVAPGQVVKFRNGSSSGTGAGDALVVNGTLVADGSGADPIIFTSETDDSAGGDTNNNGASSGATGTWQKIEFGPTSTNSVMNFAEVRFGGDQFWGGAVAGAVFVNGAPLGFTNSTVHNSEVAGLRLVGTSPTLTNVTLNDNIGAAVSMDVASGPVIAGVSLDNNGVNGVAVDGGTISANRTWGNPDIVYRLTGDVTVAAGATLTMGAGQIVKLRFGISSGTGAGDALIVNGTLKANGTDTLPITFTSEADDSTGGDTNNDGAGTSPVTGSWQKIEFGATSINNLLDHVDVRYAGDTAWGGAVPGAVFVNGAGLELTNSSIRSSEVAGLRIAAGSPTLTNVTFLNNLGAAISMDPIAQPVSGGLAATGNGTNGFLVGGGTLAASRTWGDPTLSYQLAGNVTVGAGVSLNLGAGATFNALETFGLLGTGTVNNAGVIRKATGTGTSTIAPNVVNTGSIKVQSGRLNLGGLTNNGDGAVNGTFGTNVGIARNLDGSASNPVAYAPQPNINFNGTGNAGNPQLFEVLSTDKGNTIDGFEDNFLFYSISLSGSTYVKLVDSANNTDAVGAEAVYVMNLVVPSGTTLGLNNFKLYTRAAQISGTVLNGTVTILPDGGPIRRDAPTPGRIAVVGETDDWTLFGRAGQALTVTLGTGAGSPIPPLSPSLNFGQVTLVDPDGNTLATASNPTSGNEVMLAGIALPVDGTYHIKVKAPAAQPNSTGNYILSAWDATVNLAPLELNKRVTDAIDTPFSLDRWTFTAAAGDVVNFALVAAETPAIQFDLTGPSGFTAFINSNTSLDNITLPTAGTYSLTVHGSQRQSGAYAFRIDRVTITDITLGTPFNGSLAGGAQSQLFRLALPEMQELMIALTDPDADHRNEVYVKVGSAPSRSDYQYKFTTLAAANQRVAVPSAAAAPWYILVYTERAPAPGAFTLEATGGTVFLTKTTPDLAGTAGDLTMTLTGIGFDSTTTVSLVSATSTVYPANTASLDQPTQMTAVFNAGTVPAGVYTVRVSEPGGDTSALANALTFVAGGEAKLETNVIVPNPIGLHIAATIHVEYSNTGTVAMPAPLLTLTGVQKGVEGALLTLDPALQVAGFWTSATPVGYDQSVYILGGGKTPGLLQPGESVRVPVYYAGWLQSQWDFSRPPIFFNLGMLTEASTVAADWAALQSGLRPNGISAAAWAGIYQNLTTRLGTTWGDVIRRLNEDAAYLGRLGKNVTDIRRLWGFEIQQANGIGPQNTLATAVDLAVPTLGPSMAITRAFETSIIDRNLTGPLGQGWQLEGGWAQTLSVQTDGTVYVHDGGQVYTYQPDRRRAGAFFSQPGDRRSMTAVGGGVYRLTEPSGRLREFLAGRVTLVRDPNGNQTTAGYTNGLLTSLTASSGQSITLTYNAAGRLTALASSTGQTASYTYDATNQYLVSATDADGYTTTYTYNVGTGPTTVNALTSVTHADGTKELFAYDAEGRLQSTSAAGGARARHYEYGAGGTVTVSNATDDTATYFYDDQGVLAKFVDPLGRADFYTFNAAGDLASLSEAGAITSYGYDALRRPVQVTNPLGSVTRLRYGALDTLTAVVDAKGNSTAFAYDSKGNRVSSLAADGTTDSLAYDANGRLINWTDRNQNTTTYAYNAAGQITSKTYSGGGQTTHAYNSVGRLLTVEDATGTTSQTYDAANRLQRVTYPNGSFLEYEYDAGGRRTRMTDQTGHVTRYSYNTLGELSAVLDGSGNPIVTYDYDANGRIALETKANGTTTSYAYYPAGEIASIVHRAPGGAVNSRFDFTYNSRGLVATETSLLGQWSYEYDAAGHLTHAVFDSVNPGQVPDEDRQYVYDAAGNRVRTIINGVSTDYVTNNRNQYTSVGDVTYSYDAAGNLASRTDTGGTTVFAYNADNQLVSVQPAAGPATAYQYNPFGGLYSESTGGPATFWLMDPQERDFVGQFNAAGALIARYTHGLGLVSRTGSTGAAAYYDFDVRGSTVGLADAGGGYANRYTFEPFGNATSTVGTVPNPFQFVGKSGGMTLDSGLRLMGVRALETATGQFVSDDPAGLVGGGSNLRLYADNDPVNSVDSSGFSRTIVITQEMWDAEVRRMRNRLKEYDLAHPDQSGMYSYLDWGLKCVNAPPSEAFDSDWYNGLTYEIKGGPLKGSTMLGHELNYFFQGMIAKHYGLDTSQTLAFTFGWKATYFKLPSLEAIAALSFGFKTTPVNSDDPNDKTGPAGYGAARFIDPDQALSYRINFENDAEASAPAQRVTITDQLDLDLAWDTLEFTDVGWGDVNLTVPAKTQHFTATVPMTVNDQTFDVELELDFRSATGEIFVTYQSIEPGTFLPPSNPLTGFLPPEDGTGRGQGFFSYVVRPKPSLPTGAVIRNIALIKFDENEIIATNQIDPHDPGAGTDPAKEAFNTIDAVGPTSNVAALPATVNSASIGLSWPGSDDVGGSGIVGYDVFVSDNGGPYSLFRDDTLATQGVFYGRPGHTYSFYSLATDGVGHVQSAFTPVTTTIGGASAGNKQTFTDEDGDTYTLSLSGAGQMQFLPDDPDLNGQGPIGLVILANTDPLKDSVSLKTKKGPAGDGRVSIGGIEGTGLKSISASASDLVGTGIDLTGPLGSLKVRDVKTGAMVRATGTPAQKTTITAHVLEAGVAFNLGSTITSFTLAAAGADATITAPGIATLTVKGDPRNKVGGVVTPIRGDFNADLALTGTGDPKKPTLNTANISGNVSASNWDVAANTGAVTIKGAVSGWDLDLAGNLKSLTLGDVASASVTVGGTAGTVKAKSWAAGDLTADALGSLKVSGAFGADVTLTGEGVLAGKPTLNTVRVTGAVTGSTFAVAGAVNSFTVGSFVGSALLTGFVPTNPTDPFVGGTFTAGATINTFKVAGIKDSADPAFDNSYVAASFIKTATFKSVDGMAGGPKFGLLTDDGVGKLTVTAPALSLRDITVTPTLPAELGDFEVRVI